MVLMYCAINMVDACLGQQRRVISKSNQTLQHHNVFFYLKQYALKNNCCGTTWCYVLTTNLFYSGFIFFGIFSLNESRIQVVPRSLSFLFFFFKQVLTLWDRMLTCIVRKHGHWVQYLTQGCCLFKWMFLTPNTSWSDQMLCSVLNWFILKVY